MPRLTMTTLLLVAAAMLGAVIAQPTTLGTRFDGYTYVSNVIGYVNMTTDYCDIVAAISAGNYSVALDIYATGKNSFSGLSRRTFYRFATYAPGPGVTEPLHDALAMGRNATWLDSLIKDALTKRNGSLALGLIQVAALKYFLHEVDEGYIKIGTYLNDPVNNGVLISDSTGAPHNVDEAFALWAGGSTSACATLSGWARQLGTDMETTFVGRTYLNNAMTLAINELLARSRNGTVNQAQYNTTRYLVQRYLTVLGFQGVSHAVFKTQAAIGCKRSTAEIADARAMISVHWTYLKPLLVALKANAADIKKLEDSLTASKLSYDKATAPAVRTLVSALGFRASEIGAPKFELVVGKWNCKPSVMARRLLSDA